MSGDATPPTPLLGLIEHLDTKYAVTVGKRRMGYWRLTGQRDGYRDAGYSDVGGETGSVVLAIIDKADHLLVWSEVPHQGRRDNPSRVGSNSVLERAYFDG